MGQKTTKVNLWLLFRRPRPHRSHFKQRRPFRPHRLWPLASQQPWSTEQLKPQRCSHSRNSFNNRNCNNSSTDRPSFDLHLSCSRVGSTRSPTTRTRRSRRTCCRRTTTRVSGRKENLPTTSSRSAIASPSTTRSLNSKTWSLARNQR